MADAPTKAPITYESHAGDDIFRVCVDMQALADEQQNRVECSSFTMSQALPQSPSVFSSAVSMRKRLAITAVENVPAVNLVRDACDNIRRADILASTSQGEL